MLSNHKILIVKNKLNSVEMSRKKCKVYIKINNYKIKHELKIVDYFIIIKLCKLTIPYNPLIFFFVDCFNIADLKKN